MQCTTIGAERVCSSRVQVFICFSCCALQDEDQNNLYACLRTIFENARIYGGGLFALAASVLTDLIHHDPLCFASLEAAGLPRAFVDAIRVRTSRPYLFAPRHVHPVPCYVEKVFSP